MTRRLARELAMRLSFALFENPNDPDTLLGEIFDGGYYVTLKEEDELFASDPGNEREYITRLVRGTYEHGAELDAYIEKYAKDWEFSRISRTAASIIRVAMFETLYMRDIVPPRAAVNEAVEMAKKYETPETAAFVNGVIGSFTRGEINDE